MSQPKLTRTRFILMSFLPALILLAIPTVLSAARDSGPLPAGESAPEERVSPAPPLWPEGLVPRAPGDQVSQAQGQSPLSSRAPLSPTTELTVSIVSAPWAIVDHNDPAGISGAVPRVFVVEAVITNTSDTISATNVVVDLFYQDPLDAWTLVAGEYPTRTFDAPLLPGMAYHAYWMAQYPQTVGSSFQYTVTAFADNAYAVATSDNAYDNPEPDKTVATKSSVSAGNSSVTLVSADATVGAAFTVSVEYDLGKNPVDAAFSPVGNPDFAAGAYQLRSSQVNFFDDAGTWQETVPERLYFPGLDSRAENAEVIFTFFAIEPVSTRLCSYGAIGYSSGDKYDQFYCQADKGTIIPITGTLALSMTKHASSPAVQQGQTLTYTIDYSNTGNRSLTNVWIWDEVDTTIGSILTPTIAPPGNLDETTDSRVAWYLNQVPAAGQPGSSGTLTFAVLIDGDEQDLADGTVLVNPAFLGLNEGELPPVAALTSTVTTMVQAPTITISKTDGRTTAEPGDLLTYTLRITNTGTMTATGLIITDVLPAEVDYTPWDAIPDETGQTGQTLVWDNVGPIAPGGGTVTIEIPVAVAPAVPNGTVLTDTLTVQYENLVGYTYGLRTATDTTAVTAPVLTISKSDSPDPVLTGNRISYTLAYANNGPTSATNVIITDVVPLSTTIPSCSGGVSCTISNGVVSWTIGEVPSGEGGTGTVGFSVLVSHTVDTGTLIRNEDYGILSDQTGFVSGTLVTTLVSKAAAYYDVYTFEDADGDGVYGGGESGLGGITVTLSTAVDPITTTDASGYARFRVETAGPVSVTADLPAGYFRTTPGVVYTDTVLGVTQTVYFGYAPVTSTFGVIYGTVFEDVDHDGTQDGSEPGLPGVEITCTEAVTSSVTTNQYGQYTLHFDSSGPVTITEANPAYYVSTTPDVVYTYAITDSEGPSPIDFGDFKGIRVSGQVFDDVDVDGSKDLTETGLAGAVVVADGASFTTTVTGVYTLYVTVGEGHVITVSETDPPGYLSTNAIPGDGMSRVDANTLRIDSPISGTLYTGGDFGDVTASSVITISGYVWDDNGAGGGVLANGLRDGTEPGLAGAIVSLSSGLTQTTGFDGAFTLYAPPDQVTAVTETNPSGYVSTNAIAGNDAYKVDNDTLVVNPLPGDSTSALNRFGDVQLAGTAIVTGTVFDDANESGVMEGGEAGLAGLTVTLEISGGNPIAVQTDSAGRYQFAVAPGTDIRITSAGPGGGFYPTTLESAIMRPPAAGVYPDVNFGYSDDVDVAVIQGIVFDDANSNGYQDLGELGLAGAVITLDGGNPITTTGDGIITGTFSYTVTAAGLYALHEENPAGYRSTTPDDVSIPVELGGSYWRKFGDTNSSNLASIYGSVFEDRDGDGRRDAGELGIPDVLITLDGGITTTTHLDGRYTFVTALSGWHTVVESDPDGFFSTTPNQVHVELAMGEAYQVDFGDAPVTSTFAIVMGTVFEDTDGNGAVDTGEGGIEGVLVSLSTGISTTTDLYGRYTLSTTETGYVQVSETDPDGYHSTTPDTVTVNIAELGESYVVNFGDSPNPNASSIFGTVFHDLNVSGARELIEPPLAGVTVTLSGAADPYVTNEWGQYTFQVDSTGAYTVTETDLPSYVSTNAIPGDPAVSKVDNNTLRADVGALGQELGDNQFGDVLASEVITVSGTVWDDNGAGGGVAADGVRNGTEPGLGGAVISLSSGLTGTTGSDGAFWLYAPAGEVITVSETNPPGYVSTGAQAGDGASRVDDDMLTVSGLSAGETSSGNQFLDVLPADLAVVKSDQPDPVVAGATLTYTVQVTNNGPSYAQNVILTDTLPAGVAFGTATPAQSSGPNPLVWNVGDLGVGASEVYTVVVTVGADVVSGTTLTNRVTVASNMPDPDLENNDAEETTDVAAEADVAVVKSDDPDPVAAGGVLTYTLAYANHGPSDAQGVSITDTLPAEVVFGGIVSADPPPSYIPGSHQLVWYTPTLASGASGSIVFTVTASPAAAGGITNGVVITSGILDTNTDNNYDDETTGIGSPDLVTLYGYVFEDADGNGAWDTGEAGISDVTVTLDGGITTTTDADGLYVFITAAAGVHTVVETDLPGYFSTTPNEVHVEVTLGNSYRVDFGDVLALYCTCSPDTYEEDDVPTQAAALTSGLRQDHDFCTDATDWLTFTVAAAQAVTITTSSWGQRADTFLALYDTDGQTLLAANDDYEGTGDYSSRIVWEPSGDGVYYLRTTNRGGLYGCYTDYEIWLEEQGVTSTSLYLPLVVRGYPEGLDIPSPAAPTPSVTAGVLALEGPELDALGIISHTCPDAYEVDDTWEQARPITDVVQVHSFDSNPVQYVPDKDFVWFDMPLMGAITFTVSATNTTPFMELYDEFGTALGVTGSESLVWEGNPRSRYYLSVSPLLPEAFGCAGEVGYTLQAQRPSLARLYLPLVLRGYAAP
jgi:uncharacterized repeat protein (TIGR01451 family)